jgi:hypothetical protein
MKIQGLARYLLSATSLLILLFPAAQGQDSNQPQIQSAEVKIKLSSKEQQEANSVVALGENGVEMYSGHQEVDFVLKEIKVPLTSRETPLAVAADWTAELPEGTTIELSIRGSHDGKSWGEWKTFGLDEVLAGRGELFSSSLIYLDRGTKFAQLRISMAAASGIAPSPVLKELQLTFISSGAAMPVTQEAPANSADEIQTFASSTQPPTKPSVVSRTSWGCPDGQAAPKVESQYVKYKDVTHIIVHHTDSDNSSKNWPAVVRDIWFRHTNRPSLINLRGNNWGDIGYNYLIDPSGVIYEGRAGGDNIVGFHFCETNSGTMGVALLGTFTSELPTAEALSSLKKLIAWKVAQRKISPLGISMHESSSLLLPNITGHREGRCKTVCPGDKLYNAIPSIRRGVSSLVGPLYQGHVDIVNCNLVSGWAADVNNLNTPLEVEIYDGTKLVAKVLANESRPDVGRVLFDNGRHGFQVPLPTSLKDGRPHSISVRITNSNYVIPRSGRSITCAPAGPRPVGNLDVANCDYIIGWAADRSRLNTPLEVEIYDGTKLVTRVLANAARPDVGKHLGDNGRHGFTLATPASLKDGRRHIISAKAVGVGFTLSQSGRSVTCAPAATRPTISSTSPSSPLISSRDQDVTVRGKGFQQNLAVDISFPGGGGTILRGAQIRQVTPSSFVMRVTLGASGRWVIRVRNPDSQISEPFSFVVQDSRPSISSINPSSPSAGTRNQNVVIRGRNFRPNLTVDISFPRGGGTILRGAQILNVNPDSFVMRATLATRGTWSIRVRNPDGSLSNAYNFSVR